MTVTFRIRPETLADRDAITAVTLAAFADHPHSIQQEHRLVQLLREAGALTVSLVAEEGNAVVGHIAFSPVTVAGHDLGWMGIGPLSVLPARQRRGIGKALMTAGLAAIAARSAKGCVLVGDPGYYGRFGFRVLPGLTLDGVPAEVFLGLVLAGEAPRGQVMFHPAFAACGG